MRLSCLLANNTTKGKIKAIHTLNITTLIDKGIDFILNSKKNKKNRGLLPYQFIQWLVFQL